MLGRGSVLISRLTIRSVAFSSTGTPSPIKKVGVVGLGLMGHGIAQISAAKGFQVVAVDSGEQALESGMGRIKGSLSKVYEKKVQKGELDAAKANSIVSETLSRITPTSNKEELADCDIIIEAILENIEAKTNLMKELSKVAKKDAIVASNTSSLSITEIANQYKDPSQIIGVHFFNPVQLMQLVEVIRTPHVSEQVFSTSLEFVKQIGKTPISCGDTPGFVVNRLLVPFLSQAVLLLERGDATKEDIDTAMKLGSGHPMGPIQLADYVGLDTTLSILEGWRQKYPNEPAFVVPELIREKVAQGKLGRKTGEGFYVWKGDKISS